MVNVPFHIFLQLALQDTLTGFDEPKLVAITIHQLNMMNGSSFAESAHTHLTY